MAQLALQSALNGYTIKLEWFQACAIQDEIDKTKKKMSYIIPKYVCS